MGDFLGQEKLILGQNKSNHGTNQAELVGQEESKLGHSEAKFGTNYVTF